MVKLKCNRKEVCGIKFSSIYIYYTGLQKFFVCCPSDLNHVPLCILTKKKEKPKKWKIIILPRKEQKFSCSKDHNLCFLTDLSIKIFQNSMQYSQNLNFSHFGQKN